jgi:hypothetical protein
MICKACLDTALPFGRAEVLHKYTVQYFRCPVCGFVQTEPPYWLDEAYTQAITDSDIGLVGRNIRLAGIVKVLIPVLFDSSAQFVDYGGGYGLFVRLMRDAGFDFYLSERTCPNLFAQRFDVTTAGDDHFELVTAFEVFEHLAEPLDGIGQMLQFSRNVLFTTKLLPAYNPKPGTWWYYGPEHGQHVCFYTTQSLMRISARLGLHFHSDGKTLHLLTEKRISSRWFRFLSDEQVAAVLGRFLRRQSLLPADYHLVTGKTLG